MSQAWEADVGLFRAHIANFIKQVGVQPTASHTLSNFRRCVLRELPVLVLLFG